MLSKINAFTEFSLHNIENILESKTITHIKKNYQTQTNKNNINIKITQAPIKYLGRLFTHTHTHTSTMCSSAHKCIPRLTILYAIKIFQGSFKRTFIIYSLSFDNN